jgi:SAM-dependent methyltransferase
MHIHIIRTLQKFSPRRRYLAYKAKSNVADVLATIDRDAFLSLRKTASQKAKNLNEMKYFNLDGYIQQSLERALYLGLEHSHKSILDLGTGFGFFPYVCKFFGNEVVAIDLPGHELFNDVTRFLGISVIPHRIEAFKHMPDLNRRFDLVTAFQASFNRYDAAQAWGEDEWLFFLDDLFSNVLQESGEIALELNYEGVSPGARRALKKYRTQILTAPLRLPAKQLRLGSMRRV